MRLVTGIVFLIASCLADTENGKLPTKSDSSVVFRKWNPVIKSTSESANCQCVPHHRCDDDEAASDGTDVINIRFAGECNNYLEVCCESSKVLPVEEKTKFKSSPSTSCGQRNSNGIGFRIIGDNDNEAQFAEFPWMVVLLKDSNEYVCGGALIHPNVVLTAAHCVKGQTIAKLKARAGDWDVRSEDEIYPYQELAVVDSVIHENFSSGSAHNDFALLKLSRAFTIAENVDVVCLPDSNAIFDSQRCFASGWGKDSFADEALYQAILKKVELPIVEHNDCQDRMRTTRLGRRFRLDRSFICAGGEHGKDTCSGDGGSPLVCPVPGASNRFYQAGIVSWGIGCGDDRIPGVYADVAYARSWIDEKMRLWSLETSYYEYSP